jgi:hypothetical protein
VKRGEFRSARDGMLRRDILYTGDDVHLKE